MRPRQGKAIHPNRIAVSFSDEEYQYLKQIADNKGCTVQAVIKIALFVGQYKANLEEDIEFYLDPSNEYRYQIGSSIQLCVTPEEKEAYLKHARHCGLKSGKYAYLLLKSHGVFLDNVLPFGVRRSSENKILDEDKMREP